MAGVSIETLFPQQAKFSPQMDLPGLLAAVPAKWVVYLFLDTAGAPFQLLCVKNLRASLARRLGSETELAPGRRVPYREVVGSIAWQRVDSALECDLAYAEAARTFFPATYRSFIAARRPWFIQISPKSKFPTFSRTQEPQPAEGKRIFGPLPSRAAAQKVIEGLEDAFDLCRYPSILAQSPHGVACPYKQMHKCPAPCDGSVPLGLYCMQVDLALAFLEAPALTVESHARRMHAAAAELQFEAAGRVKAYMQQLQRLADAGLRDLEMMQYLAVLRGPRAGTCKLLLASPRQMQPLLCLRGATAEGCEEAAQQAIAAAATAPAWDARSEDRLAILSNALLRPAADGVLLPLHGLSAAMLQGLVRDFGRARPEPDTASPDEGVVHGDTDHTA